MNNDIKFFNIEWRTWYSLTNFEEHFGLILPQYVWFFSHLYIGVIPKPSGQLAEVIVHIIPPE